MPLMEFDFEQITVPFRMQPGLRRMAASEPHLHRLEPGSPLHGEKMAVLQAGAALHALPGFDVAPALRSIVDRARADGAIRAAGDDAVRAEQIALAVEQDLAVLDARANQLAWMCVCTPSHWAPEDKLGLGLAGLHARVADNALLQSAAPALLKMVTAGDCWERFVWTIGSSARHDQHPRRHPPSPWPLVETPQAFAAACHFRVERQTFFPVTGADGQAVFTIRVMTAPLSDVVRTAAQALRLHDALASMSDAVLRYKQLGLVRERLLPWLAEYRP